MAASQQLPLFPDESVELAPDPKMWQELLKDIEWSYSKRETLERCALRYYFDYFGANKKTAKREMDKAHLHFLKESSNRYLRTGQILHLVISKYFRKPRPTNPKPWLLKGATDWAKKLLHDDQVHSRQYPALPTYDTPFPPVFLSEYLYDREEADIIYEEAEANMLQAITNFFTDEHFAEFRNDGRNGDAAVEQTIRIKTLPCKVIGKVDLAYQVNATVTVVDWKSGRNDGSGEDSLQLAAYALWAMDHFNCDVEMIRICKAHLSSREVTYFSFTAEVLSSARIRIVQDAERMMVVEKYGRDGISDAFTPCLQPAVCKMCAYRGICYRD